MTNLNKAPSARIDEMEKTARDGTKSASRALLWGTILAGAVFAIVHLAPKALSHTAQTQLQAETYVAVRQEGW